MEESSYTEYNELAQLTISLDNDMDKKKTFELVETKVITAGTHAYATVPEDIVRLNYLADIFKTHWYRGTGTILSEYPYTNWLSKKKWPLNEELNLHIMRYQEVTLHNLYLILILY